MKPNHFGLVTGALLLIAAQDAPTPPAQDSTFSEAFTEQSNAAKAAQAAEELDEPEVRPGAAPAAAAETPSPVPQAVESPPEPAPEPAPESAPARSDAAEPASDAAPAAAAIPAKGEPPTREFIVGVWAEPGKSCEAAMDFKADGRLIGPFPRWDLTDGVLTMTGNRQKIWLTVIDKDTMQSRRSETDPPRTLKRCPKVQPPPKS
jgi:hypothetical protein